ncbi:AMP-binding protein [Neoaquamicrobium microcysteis]|nr:AMP-binding protein [Mesorhizobium microcysteis]
MMRSTMDYGLREWARREPDRVALRFDGGAVLSFGELERMANRFANLFADCGLRHGDHVAVLLGNGPHIVALCWAASRSAIYLTPMPNSLGPVETAYIVDNSTAKLVIADPRYGGVAAELPARCAHVASFLSLNGGIEGFEPAEPRLAAMSADPRSDESPGSLMMYSSGTTGAPKGIWRPLPAMEQLAGGPPAFARDLISLFGFTAETRYLSTAPLYHAAPLRFVLAVSAAGGQSTVMEKFDAARSLDLIEEHRLTMSQWVPTMFQRLLALPEERRRSYDAPRHVRAIHGAAPCTPALKRAMIEWWGPIIEEYYSGSEGVGLTSIGSAEWLRKPGSVGAAKKGTIHILGDDDAELGPGESGRVFFSGTPPFAYFGDEAKTAGRTSRQGYQTFGDIGHVDGEGHLFLSDRLDDMIISGGVNVYPQEIEAAIEEAEGVAECGVVGFPDEEFQERPVAFVVPAAGRREASGDLLARLETHVRQRLGRIKWPREIRFVAELPRSPTGKLLRRELRKIGD